MKRWRPYPQGIGDIAILPPLSRPGESKRLLLRAVAGGDPQRLTHLAGLLLH
jgi:hypothetical protein